MKTLPTLKQLRYLVALSEEKHFGRAAEACFVTQSTLSAGIQELESLLGISIAERTKRSVMLTPIGEKLARRARGLLRETEDLVDMAAAVSGPLSGVLHLGVIPTIGPFLLPRVLPMLWRDYPDLKLYLREDQTARLLEKLAQGRLDLVLMALPYAAEGVTLLNLAEDRFSLACPAGHKLATKQRVSSADLADEPLMLLEEGHCLRDHALSACHLEGRKQVAGFEATSLQTLVQMVASGLGLTLLPQIALDEGLASGLDIAIVPLDDDAVARQIGLVWRKTSVRGEEFTRLGSCFQQVLGGVSAS